jgi:GTPase SAR1 family protein
MAYDYSELSQRVDLWAQQAYELGWLNIPLNPPSKGEVANFTFIPPLKGGGGDVRPLIVAFIGGTGVGKSSLLNRLAGKPIAKSGVARPTSKEVTLFHHQDVTLPLLPLNDIRVANHDDETQKNVIWLDMPDFDSTDAHNKELVLSWLPHIDVLIYVVSPERYRDEKAWRLLLAEGATHGWLFVMNQCDRGEIEQFADFEKQLLVAGFDAPIIFKTSCVDASPPFEGGRGGCALNDEFENLAQILTSLATKKTIEQLEQRGEQVRAKALQNQLQTYATQLGSETALKKLHTHWQHNWKNTAVQLEQSFAWRLKPLAEHFAQRAMMEKSGDINLWDEFAQTQFDDALNSLALDAQLLNLPTVPLEMQLLNLREKAKKQFSSQVELHTRQALAQRGNALQRGVLKFFAIAEILLPLTAMSWVGFQVVNGYVESNQTHDHYLNLDFAIHSTLLCSLSWLVPFFILKKCQPSLEKCALRGLNKGTSKGLDSLNHSVNLGISQFEAERAEQISQLNELKTACELLTKTPVEIDKKSDLGRMVISNHAAS